MRSSTRSRMKRGRAKTVFLPRQAERKIRAVRASISLDGKFIGTPAPFAALETADELLLRVLPVIKGGCLYGDPTGFLSKDFRFKLLSVTPARGTLLLRYQRIKGGGRRVC